jgi:hypothetical protein
MMASSGFHIHPPPPLPAPPPPPEPNCLSHIWPQAGMGDSLVLSLPRMLHRLPCPRTTGENEAWEQGNHAYAMHDALA